MKLSTRIQDVGTLIAGAYAALSPVWVSTIGERDALWTLIVLGVLLVGTALYSLSMPDLVAAEWLTVLFGALLFIAPWVFSYTHLDGASWTSWIAGGVAVVLGSSVVATSNSAQHVMQH